MRTPIGARDRRVGLDNPGPAVSDGDGTVTQTRIPLRSSAPDGCWWVSIVPATARNMERVVAGTVLATATHLVGMLYHPEVTTQTRVTYGDRILNVTSVVDEDEQHVELVLVCVEVVG